MEREVFVLFADMAGYTALTEAHGDLDAATIAERFYVLARGSLAGSARMVKTIGDAVMIVADSADDALATAITLARAVEAEPRFPTLRTGLHGGPAIERNGDYYGATVNLAARVASHAQGGQILCTRCVADAGRVHAQPRGTATFKNVLLPVEIFAVDDTAVGLQIDPICRMVVSPGPDVPQREHDGRVVYFCSEECAARFTSIVAR